MLVMHGFMHGLVGVLLAGDGRTTVLEALIVFAQAVVIIGLIWERQRRRAAERALNQRLEFETLVSELSSSLTMLRAGDRPSVVLRWLRRLADCLEIDGATLVARQHCAQYERVPRFLEAQENVAFFDCVRP